MYDGHYPRVIATFVIAICTVASATIIVIITVCYYIIIIIVITTRVIVLKADIAAAMRPPAFTGSLPLTFFGYPRLGI